MLMRKPDKKDHDHEEATLLSELLLRAVRGVVPGEPLITFTASASLLVVSSHRSYSRLYVSCRSVTRRIPRPHSKLRSRMSFGQCAFMSRSPRSLQRHLVVKDLQYAVGQSIDIDIDIDSRAFFITLRILVTFRCRLRWSRHLENINYNRLTLVTDLYHSTVQGFFW